MAKAAYTASLFACRASTASLMYFFELSWVFALLCCGLAARQPIQKPTRRIRIRIRILP